jgi:methylase of polypeptide subunit release factors
LTTTAENMAASFPHLTPRVTLKLGSFEALPSLLEDARVDLLVCNPPYHIEGVHSAGPSFESRRSDPREALFGDGPDGRGAYRDLAKACPLCVKEGGFVVFEVPDIATAEFLVEVFGGELWEEKERLTTGDGHIRGVVLRRRPDTH